MLSSGHEYEHFTFIQSTDRKSLFTQIKKVVEKAQEVAAEELHERSRRLKKLLEREDKIYEEEFANKVKTRIDEDIHERKDALHAIMEENTRTQQQFLEKKRVQQVMECCYEIRERLRAEDLKNVKICQQEQIVEKLRQKRRECEVNKFWSDVEKRRWQRFDENAERENCLRQLMNDQTRHVLQKQVQEGEDRREQERREKAEDARKLNEVLEEMRLERFERENQPASPQQQAYAKELLADIAARKAARDAEALALKEEHLALIRECQRLEAEERAMIAARKRDFYHATLEYIKYVRRMRELEMGMEKLYNDRIEDLAHVDLCTKSNIAETMRLKAEEAARCHALLKRQICEEAERRLREDAEHRENKILENRFVHPEVTREQILAQQRKNRADLDQQIIELKRIREEEEKRFENRLLKAIDDSVVCTQLAEEYIREGVDYLAPHPNWRILACPTVQYGPRAPKTLEQFQQERQRGSIEQCPCPLSALHNCEFMRTQKICAEKLNAAGDMPLVGNEMTKSKTSGATDAFRNCLCPAGTRRHAMMLNARGFMPEAGDAN